VFSKNVTCYVCVPKATRYQRRGLRCALRTLRRLAPCPALPLRGAVACAPAIPRTAPGARKRPLGHLSSVLKKCNVLCVRPPNHSIPTPWPQVRVAHVAAAGSLPGLAPAGAVAYAPAIPRTAPCWCS